MNQNNNNIENNLNKNLDNKNKEIINDDNDKKLLKTIYMSNNLLYLGNQLPPDYSQEIKISYISKKNKQIKINTDLYNSDNTNNDNNIQISSDDKRILLSEVKKKTLQPTHLRPIIRHSLFSSHKNGTIDIKNIENHNNNLSINILNNNANILTPKNNLKGNVKLKHINSTLLSNNKNTNLSSENNNNTNNNIYYRTGSQVPNNKVISNKLNNEKDIQNILVENELKELKEKEMKNHYFLDSDKLNAILCKKRIKKNHGHKKGFKFKLK